MLPDRRIRYDMALSHDLKEALSSLDPKVEMESDKVSDLFDLYMVTRRFYQDLSGYLGQVSQYSHDLQNSLSILIFVRVCFNLQT